MTLNRQNPSPFSAHRRTLTEISLLAFLFNLLLTPAAGAEDIHDKTACGRIPKLNALETQYRILIQNKIAEFDYAKQDEAVAELIEFSQRLLKQTTDKSKGHIEFASQLANRESCDKLHDDLDRIVAEQQKLWEAQVQLVTHFASVVMEQLPLKTH